MPRVSDGFATIVASEFLKTSTKLMQEDLRKSGLEDSDLFAVPLPNPPVPMQNPTWVMGAYRIPYFDRNGATLEHMYRDRLFYRPEFQDQLKAAGMGKYKGPSHAQTAQRGLDSTMPYLYPGGTGTIGIVCEGEKKTVKAAERFDTPVIGIGGCWNWAAHRPTDAQGRRVGPQVVHPDILWWVEHNALTQVVIVSDPDITTNNHIATGYNGLATRLRSAFPDLLVRVVAPADKLDDLLVSDEGFDLDQLLELEDVPDLELSQSVRDLIAEYDLVSRQNAQGVVSLFRNAYNVSRLLENHPKWKGQLRFNSDERLYELFGAPVKDGYHPHQICSIFNRHLHMPELTPKIVWEAMVRVAKDHAYSPAQEDVKACGEWDRVPRLRHIFGKDRTENEIRIAEAFVCGYVKRVMEPGCFYRIMTILVGPQFVGKTGMSKWLAGSLERVALFHPGDFKFLTKDTKLKLVNCSVALFDDVETFSHAELGHLKSIVSQTHVVERVAYGVTEERFNRRGIMMGTANDKAIVPDDPTGNSRFAVLELHRMQDFEWLNQWRSQIIAEAWHMVRGGWEPQIDFKAVTQEFTEKSALQDKLEEFIELLRAGKMPMFVLQRKHGAGRYFKMDSFWQWYRGMDYRPKDWERKDFGQRARAMGLVYIDNNGGSPLADGTKARRVWTF